MIVILIALLLNSNVRIYVRYIDSLYAYISVFGIFKIRLYPSKGPKRSLSAKQLRRMHGKLHAKENKKGNKKVSQKEQAGQVFGDAKDMIKHLYELIASILKRLAYRVKIRVKKLDITVATKDAAATALTYSIVCNTLSVLMDMITGYDKVKCRIDHAACRCDYLLESFSASVDIVIKVKIIHTFSVLLGTLMNG